MLMMLTTAPYLHRPRWRAGLCCSVIVHMLLVALLITTWRDNTPPPAPPAAVMLAFSEQFQVTNRQPDVPLGINQQQKVDAATPETRPEKQQMHRVVTADNAELQQPKTQKASPKPTKPHDMKHKNLLPQKAMEGNAKVTNRAAPKPQLNVASTTAAPVASDAATVSNSQLSWEGLVKGKLNLVKAYPADARRRGRSGIVLVSFVVGADGGVISRQLIRSSETLSLDRESLAMIDRAQPFPPPPAEILTGGLYKVTMPVSFYLNQAN